MSGSQKLQCIHSRHFLVFCVLTEMNFTCHRLYPFHRWLTTDCKHCISRTTMNCCVSYFSKIYWRASNQAENHLADMELIPDRREPSACQPTRHCGLLTVPTEPLGEAMFCLIIRDAPIIGISRLMRWYRPIVVYTDSKCKFSFLWPKADKYESGFRFR